MTKDKPLDYDHNANSYKGLDSRIGRLKEIKTDRGDFRFKEDRK